MDDREFQKLRDILVERLIAGEDSTELEAQLAARLGPGEATALLSEARDRVEARRSDPNFERAVREIRQRRGGFWRGPIKSREQAGRIAKIAAGWFGGIGVLLLLLLVAGGRRDVSALIAALLFALPAVALWTRQSPVAAGVLAGLSALACAGWLTFMIAMLVSGEAVGGMAVSAVAAVIPWIALLLLALRAFSATRYLKRLPATGADPTVFD